VEKNLPFHYYLSSLRIAVAAQDTYEDGHLFAQAGLSADILDEENGRTDSPFIDASMLWKNVPSPRVMHEEIRGKSWIFNKEC